MARECDCVFRHSFLWTCLSLDHDGRQEDLVFLVCNLFLQFPENYPVKPPKVRMMNYIDHPNVFGGVNFRCCDINNSVFFKN